MDFSPQSRCNLVRDESYDVDFRLQQLGMTRGWIWTAMTRGALAHRLAPPHGFDGNASYHAADRALSELCLEPLEVGWHRGSFLRIPVAMNRFGTLAVGVTTGDENTGIVADHDPRTTTLKGPATHRLAEQLDFSRSDEDINGVEYWIALAYWSTDEVRCEVSRPFVPDADGHISGWSERVIITAPESPTGTRRPSADSPTEQVPPIVRRRVA